MPLLRMYPVSRDWNCCSGSSLLTQHVPLSPIGRNQVIDSTIYKVQNDAENSRNQHLACKPCNHEVYADGAVREDGGERAATANKAETDEVSEDKQSRKETRANMFNSCCRVLPLQLADS